MYLTYSFSGWIGIFHFKPNQTTTQHLISECCSLFEKYEAPEEITSDGGPQFTSKEFQSFLKDWGVFHCNSSAGYPQSNEWAELAVKTSKRMIMYNTSKNGDLNNNKAARAILQYHNIPIPKIGLSPAQILFHRQLRDHIPTNPEHYMLHKQWILSAEQWEHHFWQRDQKITIHYNTHTQSLLSLPVQTPVLVQNLKKKNNLCWLQSGTIVEALPFNNIKSTLMDQGELSQETENK